MCAGYAYELGLPWLAWHAFIYWNPHSVLFDVCFCIMAYTTVLTIEFAPAIVEKLPWKGFRDTFMHWHHRLATAVVLGRRTAFVDAPVVPRRIVPDLQGQDVSALVHAAT